MMTRTGQWGPAQARPGDGRGSWAEGAPFPGARGGTRAGPGVCGSRGPELVAWAVGTSWADAPVLLLPRARLCPGSGHLLLKHDGLGLLEDRDRTHGPCGHADDLSRLIGARAPRPSPRSGSRTEGPGPAVPGPGLAMLARPWPSWLHLSRPHGVGTARPRALSGRLSAPQALDLLTRLYLRSRLGSQPRGGSGEHRPPHPVHLPSAPLPREDDVNRNEPHPVL